MRPTSSTTATPSETHPRTTPVVSMNSPSADVQPRSHGTHSGAVPDWQQDWGVLPSQSKAEDFPQHWSWNGENERLFNVLARIQHFSYVALDGVNQFGIGLTVTLGEDLSESGLERFANISHVDEHEGSNHDLANDQNQQEESVLKGGSNTKLVVFNSPCQGDV